MTEQVNADLAVIGSGPGGALTAALAAEAGLDVVIVEEGTLVPQGTYPPFSYEQMANQYRNGGLTVALGRPPIAYAEGKCVGGGSEVNSGLYHRTPSVVLEEWAEAWRLDDCASESLGEYEKQIEEDLSIGPLPFPAPAMSQRLADGAAEMGWHATEVPRWFRYDKTSSGWQSRKQSMSETYIPRATTAGTTVLAETRALKLRKTDGRVKSAVLEQQRNNETVSMELTAKNFVVSAGSIQSPALLQRSGIRRNIGGNLRVHPTMKLAALFDEDVAHWDVPVHQVKEFAPNLSFGGSVSQPGQIALAFADNWKAHGEFLDAPSKVGMYYASIRPEGGGRVIALPGVEDPLVLYNLTKRDIALLGTGLTRLALMLFAAGAKAVCPSIADAPVLRGPDDLWQIEENLSRSRSGVMTIHLCSTIPMGETKKSGANSFGKLHGYSNLFINDGSMLPSAPGVNPQGPILTMAMRNARYWLDQGAWR